MQLSLILEIHKRESNPVSQAFLDEHREDFTQDAWRILLELLKGDRLTNREVINRNISMSPTRRWCDIQEWGVQISKQEISVPYSSRKVMEYWLESAEIVRVYHLIASGLKIVKIKKAA